MSGEQVLERERESAALEQLVRQGLEGHGAVVVLEGPAGIGKTTLLARVRETAAENDAGVHSARASELDRGFAFGVVHQLLEGEIARADPERRARLFSGAAARCEVLFGAAGPAEGDAEYAVLSGLYWLVVNLAEERPVVLVVDDLHWADLASARFLEFLGRRIEGLPVALVVTARPDEPGAPQDVIDEIAAGPMASRVSPLPLSEESVVVLLESALGVAPASEFAQAALAATGGNPLLVSTLSQEAGALELRGLAGEAAGLAALVASGVAPTVARRLRSLGATPVAAAHALAVVGDGASDEDVAAVAGIERGEASAALDRLARAGVLLPRERRFTHPLVRSAVAESIDRADRTRMHRLAAERLRERGARPAQVAVHWLEADPRGDAGAVADLVAAARAAAAEGATESAVQLLRRAIEEPAPPEDRAQLLLELGELEVRAQLPQGPDRLRDALGAGLEGDLAVRARAALGTHLVHTDPLAAIDEVEAAHRDARDPGLRLRLEAFTMESLIFPDAFAQRRDARFAAGNEDPAPSPVMLAHLALQRGAEGAPLPEVRELCARAQAGGSLVAEVGPASSTWNLLAHAMRYGEDADGARLLIAAGERTARDQGLRAAGFFVEQAWAYWHRDFGSVAAGAARAATGLELVREAGLVLTIPVLGAACAENLVELGKLDEAAEMVDSELPDVARDTFMEPFVLTVRGHLRSLLHRDDAAEADLRRVIALDEARGWKLPNVTRARLRLAELLARSGRTDEALELADHDVAVARGAQTPGSLGMALRVRAAALEGDAARTTLEEAIEALAPTPMRREHGWALHDLGAHLRRGGSPREAREPLRLALDIATRAEAGRLASAAQDELAATGAHARRAMLTGVESLTPSERRVADLAAEGLTNRQIAESLWLSIKTVEVHLGRTYGKLEIRSRQQLAGALGGVEAVA